MKSLDLIRQRVARFAGVAAAFAFAAQACAAPQYAQPSPTPSTKLEPPKFSDPRQDQLKKWIDAFFPWGDGEIAIESRQVIIEGREAKTPGTRIVIAKKTYTADARLNDQVFAVLDDDGKTALVGDIFVAEERVKAPVPVVTDADLVPLRDKLTGFLRSKVQMVLNAPADRRGWKAVKVRPTTGYGPYDIDGFVDADTSSVLLLGRAWDRQRSVVEQRKPMLKIDSTPSTGPADAKVTLVEFSDMQCAFCKRRSGDMETLLAKLSPKVKVKRYFKSFPLTEVHPWAFRAASAGRCFFEINPELFLRWKSNIYSKQDSLTVPDLDTFAMDFATSSDVAEKTFSECYLRQKSIDRVLGDLSEGFALRVRSTPTYFIDGVLVPWSLDETMEEFLRKTYMGGEGLPLPKPTIAPAKTTEKKGDRKPPAKTH